MPGAELPPVEQVFTVNASEFLAGVDEMLAGVERLAAGIDEVAVAAGRLDVGIAGAADADARLAEAETAASERVNELVASMDRLDESLMENAAAADRAAESFDAAALSEDRMGASGDAAGASAAKMGSTLKLAAIGAAVAIGIGVEQAAKFEQQMERIHTQAGVTQSAIKGLSQGVLQLAGEVGVSPDSLAESLYHVESNMASLGITGPKALNMVRVAAEGARIGGANVVDVTNALTAAIASGIPGVQNYQQAMGALNATVGAGDMSMQDLADAMGTGMLAVVKGYGLSLTDVSAALATFGDNNIRGAKAGTDLRMAVQAMAVPMATAGAELAKLGMTQNTLATDMQKHGLLYALQDFQKRMKAAGVTADQEGQVITDVFGKKAGAGVSILLEQMDRLKSKYPDIEKAMGNFSGDWKSQTKTMAQQWADLKEGADGLAISFGQLLLPAATKLVGALAGVARFLVANPAVAAFAGAILAIAVAFKVAAAAEAIFNAETIANPVMLAVMAVAALVLGLYELYKHSKMVRDIVADVGKFFQSVWQAAMRAAGVVIQWFVHGPLTFIKQELQVFSVFWAGHGQQIEAVAKAVWRIIAAIIQLEWSVASAFVKAGLIIMISVFQAAWAVITGVVRTAWNVIAIVVRTAIAVVLDTISLAMDVLTGRWDAAWRDVRNIASTMINAAKNIVVAVASGFGSILWNAGQSLIRGLIGGIESMFGSLGGIMGKVAGLVKSFLPFSPAKQGPLSGSGDPSYSGRSIARKLAQGLTDGTGDVTAAMHRLAGSAGLATAGNGALAITGAGPGGLGGAGGGIGPVHVTVNGFVGNNQELAQQIYLLIQQATLQNNRRNITNGLSLRFGS